MMIFIAELAITVLFIWLAKVIQDVLTVFDDDEELFTADNPALGIAKAGYYLAAMIALSALFMGKGSGDWWEVRDFAVYGLLALILLNVSTLSVEHLMLRGYKIYDQICQHRNESVGWALMGSYLGSAFILMGALSGDDRDLYSCVLEVTAYFLLGQLALVVAAMVFDRCNRPHHQALEAGNVSAGLAFGGYLIGVGVIVGGMSRGNLHLTSTDLTLFAIHSIASIALLSVLRHWLFPWIFAHGESLRDEIYRDRNRAAGWIMALGCIGTAKIIVVATWSWVLS